jgi:hypothetical protein
MVMIAAANDCDNECGSPAASSAAVSKVDALLMLMMPSREWVGESAAAAEAASAAADGLRSLSILKAQCVSLRSAGAGVVQGSNLPYFITGMQCLIHL